MDLPICTNSSILNHIITLGNFLPITYVLVFYSQTQIKSSNLTILILLIPSTSNLSPLPLNAYLQPSHYLCYCSSHFDITSPRVSCNSLVLVLSLILKKINLPLSDAYWTSLSPAVRSPSSKLHMLRRTSKRSDSTVVSTSV